MKIHTKLVCLCTALFTVALSFTIPPSTRIVSVKSILGEIGEKKVDRIVFSENLSKMLTIENDGEVLGSDINPFQIPPIIQKATENDILTIFEKTPPMVSFLKSTILPLAFFGGLLFLLSPAVSQQQSLINTTPKSIQPEEIPGTNLTQWSGSPEIFHECYEVISFLNQNERFKDIGAKVPRGILLEGPPGTGKTMLARGIAKETGAAFYSISGSEFVELFVGLGAKRVRTLFSEARKNKPSIIFIDEIDAIGKQRGMTLNSNDEREQTLNQLLSEMDGFEQNENLLVIAATNRRDVLDKALLRPGRFDRVINVPLPDADSRREIFRTYLEKVKMEYMDEILLESLADNTEGMSGADISNMINEASILAVREDREYVHSVDLYNALEKIMVGIVKKRDTRSEEIRKRVAIHEIGHALAIKESSDYRLDKISIQASYRGAGGYTLYSSNREKGKEDDNLYTKEKLVERIMIFLGGKAAERVFYGEDGISTGATSDLQQANTLVMQLLKKFGMSKQTPHFFDNEDGPISENLRSTMEKEANDILEQAFDNIVSILDKNKAMIQKVVPILLERESMVGQEFLSLFL